MKICLDGSVWLFQLLIQLTWTKIHLDISYKKSPSCKEIPLTNVKPTCCLSPSFHFRTTLRMMREEIKDF